MKEQDYSNAKTCVQLRSDNVLVLQMYYYAGYKQSLKKVGITKELPIDRFINEYPPRLYPYSFATEKRNEYQLICPPGSTIDYDADSIRMICFKILLCALRHSTNRVATNEVGTARYVDQMGLALKTVPTAMKMFTSCPTSFHAWGNRWHCANDGSQIDASWILGEIHHVDKKARA